MSIANLFPPDGNNDPGYNWNFSPDSGSGIAAFAQNTDNQALYDLMLHMSNTNNDIMASKAFFIAMQDLAQKEGNNIDPQIASFLNGLTGPDGRPVGTFFADMFAAQVATMKDPVAQISKMIAALSAGVPNAETNALTGPIIQELESLDDKGSYQAFLQTNNYVNSSGQLGFIDPVTKQWHDCSSDPDFFNNYLSGQVGNWINTSTTFKDQLKDERMYMVDSLVNDPRVKQGGPAFLLFVLVFTLLNSGNDSQEAGYANNTQANSDQSKENAQVISNFNQANFSGQDAGKNAAAWMASLLKVQGQLDINSNDGDVVASSSSGFSSIENTQVDTSGTTLLAAYQAGQKSGDYSGLAAALKTAAGDPSQPSAGGTPNQFNDNFSTISKSLTSQSSTISTKMQALAQVVNQGLTAMTTACNQEKSMRQAACDAVTRS